MRRRILAIAAAAIAVSAGLFGTLTTAGGQSEVDHDMQAAEAFSNGKPCPAGQQIGKTEWEEVQARIDSISEGFELDQAAPTMVDQIAVRLHKLPAEIPKGLAGDPVGAVSLCVQTEEGLMDTGALTWLVDMPVEKGNER